MTTDLATRSSVCPFCGSDQVASTTTESTTQVPYGPAISYVQQVDTCGTCGESGDFAGHNDAAIERAQTESRQRSMGMMLEALSTEHGRSMAYIERALLLPQRTLARWKTGDGFSAASAALLRLVTTFPWLLEVADAKFAPRIADGAVLAAAAVVIQTFTLPVASPREEAWRPQPAVFVVVSGWPQPPAAASSYVPSNSAILHARLPCA